MNLFQNRAGLTSAKDVLKVAQAYQNETNYTVWSNLATNIASIRHLLQVCCVHFFFIKKGLFYLNHKILHRTGVICEENICLFL